MGPRYGCWKRRLARSDHFTQGRRATLWTLPSAPTARLSPRPALTRWSVCGRCSLGRKAELAGIPRGTPNTPNPMTSSTGYVGTGPHPTCRNGQYRSHLNSAAISANQEMVAYLTATWSRLPGGMQMYWRARPGAAPWVLALLCVAACGTAEPAPSGVDVQTITWYTSATIEDNPFAMLVEAFERAHPAVRVKTVPS